MISKLRTLGVSVTPFVSSLSDPESPKTLTFSFLAAIPISETATALSFDDSGTAVALPLPLSITDGSDKYTEQAGLQIYEIQATGILPSSDKIAIPQELGYLPLSYSLALSSSSGEQENIAGKVVVFAEGKEELGWEATPPKVTIENISDGDTISADSEITAAISDGNEKFKVGWFVSGGKIKNRRALETKWTEIPSGPQTIIVTIRGKTTSSFSWHAIDVTVE